MPEYKLTYFDVRALGEPIRWVLTLAGVPFEDNRINFADWPTLKETPEFPTGQMPVLLEDGKPLTQSMSIGRYLARKYNFVSDDPFLNYRSEQVVDILEDTRKVFRNLVMQRLGPNDEEKIKEIKEDLLNNVFPKHFKQIASIVDETEGDFVAGKQLTFGDLYLANWFDIYEDAVDKSVLDNFPSLKKLQQAVMNLPALKPWIASRPTTMV